MNIQWVLADHLVLDPTADITKMKQAGSFWGSWRTWRAYNTDNVICHDMQKAEELVKRAFHAACNMYIPNSVYNKISRPQGVKLYEGDFMGHDVYNQDEIVAMNLAGSVCEVVLLLGFDWTAKEESPDKNQAIRDRNYYGLIEQAIKSRPDVQWILVDHPGEICPQLKQYTNLDKDTLENVLTILNG